MKIIVVGATGLIGTEVIRQALLHKSVTSVVALGRRPTPPPESVPAGPELEKFQSVTLEDFTNYTEHNRPLLTRLFLFFLFRPFRLLAITPTASKTMDFEAVKTVCVDYVMKGFDTLKQLPRPQSGKPLRFVYASGAKAERDQTKKPWILGDYTLMRVSEPFFVKYARPTFFFIDPRKKNTRAASKHSYSTPPRNLAASWIRASCASASSSRPGYITGMLAHAAAGIIGLPLIDIREFGGAAVSAAVHGFDKDTLDNDELIAMGRKELREIGEEPST
ncbi:hypothetical protein BBAD15_g8534 [Beauveria bassiana D1-5]|uniref:Oxidoreductase HTATIP2 n=1 Tax=Beauveria bassiana D1-5 TaxID=1245745 RepID=A0A0A2VZJ5_BEABA|nr:hypothetical protein BBAD15_g8534 [Beauveria bassiana D1-5]